jgi:hypothetical protein
VTFHLKEDKIFIEAHCAELFLDFWNFHLKKILKVTYPQHVLARCPAGVCIKRSETILLPGNKAVNPFMHDIKNWDFFL